MKKVLLAVTLLLLAGCGAFSGKKSSLIEVGEREQVRDCKLLQSFKGPSGFRMWGPPMNIANFKNQAMDKAEKIGATHILWRTETTDLGETAFVDAYKCPVDQDTMKNSEEE